jgi:hypothetical protein
VSNNINSDNQDVFKVNLFEDIANFPGDMALGARPASSGMEAALASTLYPALAMRLNLR